MPPMLQGYETGMKQGTIDAASWCLYFYIEFNFFSGGQLDDLSDDLTYHIAQLEQYDAKLAIVVMKLLRYMISRLRGVSDETPEAELEKLCEDQVTLQAVFYRTKMYLACFLGNHDLTAALSYEWQPKLTKVLPAQLNVLETTFVSALSCMAESRMNPKNSKLLKQAKLEDKQKSDGLLDGGVIYSSLSWEGHCLVKGQGHGQKW